MVCLTESFFCQWHCHYNIWLNVCNDRDSSVNGCVITVVQCREDCHYSSVMYAVNMSGSFN